MVRVRSFRALATMIVVELSDNCTMKHPNFSLMIKDFTNQIMQIVVQGQIVESVLERWTPKYDCILMNADNAKISIAQTSLIYFFRIKET